MYILNTKINTLFFHIIYRDSRRSIIFMLSFFVEIREKVDKRYLRFLTNLNNYFNLQICLILQRLSITLLNFRFLQSCHKMSNKSCLLCVKSERYAFLVKLLGSMRPGTAELHKLGGQAKPRISR